MGLFSRRRSSKRLATKPFRPRFEMLELRQMLSAADLTTWAGVGNVTSPNNYTVISASSAGGTFDGRRFGSGEAAAYLADTTLLTPGGASLADLTRNTTGGFTASGSVTFSAAAATAAPQMYFGFFDNENLASGAFGASIQEITTTGVTFKAIGGTTLSTITSGVTAFGTYTFNIDVNNATSGAGNARFRLFNSAGNQVVSVIAIIPSGATLAADSFGFLQPLATSDVDTTFSFTANNINYTGETQQGAAAPPAAPTNVAATTFSTSQINLTWTDNATNETGFVIDRATNSAFTTGLVTATAAANATSYSATGLAESTTYYFRVRATNAGVDSTNSSTVNATTATAAPGVANLLGWTGVGNQSTPNDYEAISTTSAGGTIDGRRFGTGEAASYFADTMLLDGAGDQITLTRTTAGGFSATGTLVFDASANSNIVDPLFYYGFFDKANLASGAFGFTIANQTATSFRFRASAGTAQTTGSGTILGDGAYTYDIDVNNADSGANTVRVRLYSGSTTVVNVTVAIPTTGTPVADSFGFLQPLAASGSNDTFSLTVSNINYTGDSQQGTGLPPAAPTSLTATAAGANQINLAWTDNSSDETEFEIDRATDSAFTTGLDTVSVAANTSSYSAGSLTASTTYYFRVRSVNEWGGSTPSNIANATTSAGATAPAAPSSLAATATSSSQINLTWTDNAGNETGFEIDRATNSAFTANLVTVNAAVNAVSYSATGLTASTTYYFRVRATNSVGDSANSNTASTTTSAGATAPAAPSSLAATATSSSQINLTWTDNANNETGFKIDRATNSAFTGAITFTAATNATSYSATGLAASTTYYFRVRATNSVGDSANTTTASATTSTVGSSFYLNLASGSDSNNGTSSATPWRTLQKALQAAPLTSDSTVYIAGGSYTQNQDISADPSPSRTGLVTFKPAIGATVTIQGSGTGSVEWAWRGVKNVRVEGLKFVNVVPYIIDTKNIQFVDNDFTNSGFWFFGSDGVLMDNNNFGGYVASHPGMNFRGHGTNTFYFTAAEKQVRHFTNNNLVISNNTMNMGFKLNDAIQVINASEVTIENNDITGISTTSDAHGDSIQLVEVNTATISGNIMRQGRGIIVHHLKDAKNNNIPFPNGMINPLVNHDLTFINNVHANSGSDFSLRAEYAPRLKVINNTFWGLGTSAGNGLDLKVGVTDAIVLNNIVSVMRVVSGTTFKARGNNLIGILYDESAYPSLFTGDAIVGSSYHNTAFVDYAGRNFKLTPAATAAINQGVTVGNQVQGDADGNGVIDATPYTIVATTGIPTVDRDGETRTGVMEIGAYNY